MVWQDLLLDRWIDGQSLGRALATVFQVSPKDVRVVDEISPALEATGLALLVERTRRRGQFPLQLSVYVRNDDVWRRVQGFSETVRLVRQLCGLVDSSCLITGDAGDPEADLLVRPSGEILRVTLDEDRLGRDEFMVVAAEPFEPAPATV